MGEGEKSVEFMLSSSLPLRAPGAQPSGPTEKPCRMCLRTISVEQQKGEALFPVTGAALGMGEPSHLTWNPGKHRVSSIATLLKSRAQGDAPCLVAAVIGFLCEGCFFHWTPGNGNLV